VSEALRERLRAPGPKRILALDGGGVRGVVALAFLERVEALLRERLGRPDLRLCEYFDLVGGTSTGSIIAASLAVGMEVEEIRDLYLTAGRRVFARRKVRIWQALYDDRPFREVLSARLGDVVLGDARVRTGLAIVTKRADTNSTWPLMNHPDGRFYGVNRGIRLADAVRASAAAPVMFQPARVEVAPGETGVFVDGAVSMANNPALLLLLLATLRGYPFRWPVGEDRLLLVSVGTGLWRRDADPIAVARAGALRWAATLPEMLIADARDLTELLLQALSKTPTARVIDEEVGDLSGDVWLGTPALSYLRYDARLEPEALAALGCADLVDRLPELRRLAGARSLPDLARIGAAAARAQVRAEHFPPAFDPVGATA
jgi:hypothetical protein